MTGMAKQPGNLGHEADAGRRALPRSYVGRVMLDLVGQRGAQAGLVWIGVLVIMAVFAPFIANSHPYLLKMNDRWSSPLLRHLTAADVTWLLSFVAAVVLLPMRRLAVAQRLLLLVLVICLTAGVAWFTVTPPKTVVFSQYREATAAGTVQFALYAPIRFSPTDRQREMTGDLDPRLNPPSRTHIMGTTAQGEDLASRMIHATRIALSIGFIATGIAVVIGVTLGGLMGYFSGWVDLLGMRLVEVFSAIPTIYLLIAIVAFYERNLYLMMVVIGLTSWVGYAVFTRAEFLRLRKQDFVQAAIAAGLPLRSVLFKHMLPNGLTPVLVSASFGVASAILTESTLSFLGLGLVDQPSWGQMLNEAHAGGNFFLWIAFYPGMAIFLTVFAYNLVGEALRDAIDPHLKKQAHLQ
jgi:peptide/nickel transport system permease protein